MNNNRCLPLLPQELIYKEFFSQGDLVCVRLLCLLNDM